MRNAGVIRVLQMSQLLRAGRRSLDELAGQFGVTTRTVRRDLELLSLVGFRVRSTKDNAADGREGYWWVEP